MEFTPAWLERYLSHRLGSAVIVKEEDITRFPRGSSRETWFINYRSKDDIEALKSIVFRLDFRGGSTDPSSLDQEYFMYERLGQTDVPVAKALWWEDDPSWTDRPFYTREHVEGSWDVPHYQDPDPAYDEMRIAISKEHLSKLALIHQLDWKALGFDKYLPAPTSVEDCAKVFVESLMSMMEDIRTSAIPLFLEAGEWLIDNAPIAPRISLCKGTNGLGEEIFRGQKIVAMSDWEEASIGHPAADFAFMQDFVPEIEHDGQKIWGLEHALDYYYSLSGIRITPEAVAYYHKLRSLKTILFGQKAGGAIHANFDGPIRQTWTGTEVLHIGKYVTASAIGIVPPHSGDRFSELNQLV
ncbi:MAG: phosphotransferase family protein [Tissierellales bacterium]